MIVETTDFVEGDIAGILNRRIIQYSKNKILPSLIIWKTTGSTSLGRILMIVRVVISKVTLVPVVSFALSSLTLTPTTYLGPLEALTMTLEG